MNYGKDYNLFFLNKIDNFVREPFDERLKEGSPISDLIFSNRFPVFTRTSINFIIKDRLINHDLL